MTRRKTTTLLPFLLVLVAITDRATAFQNELLLYQAIQASRDVAPESWNEFFFAAVNLVDAPSTPSSFRRLFVSPTLLSSDTHDITTSPLLLQPPQRAPLPKTIPLSPAEQELFQLILQVRDTYCPTTTIRVVGGWVRDKLLPSSTTTTTSMMQDVDFVLSNVSGQDFARYVQDYLQEHHHYDDNNDDIDNNDIPKTHKKNKSKNIKQSNHLQTASLPFQKFDLDFAQLRVETYHASSRVPQISSVASIVEDAWRRDLTINSLFYNIHTNQVEDWTEQGLQDLQLGILATPTVPLATLLEDPLRMLRAIRLAARLSFRMDPALYRAACHPRVHEALLMKVSKDRMGREIDILFQTNDPARGVQLLLETNLMTYVLPVSKEKDDGEEGSSIEARYQAGYDLLARTQRLAGRIHGILPSPLCEKTAQCRYLWYAAFFQPFWDMTTNSRNEEDGGTHDQQSSRRRPSRRGRNRSMVYQLMTQEWKRPTRDTDAVERILVGVETFQTFWKAVEPYKEYACQSLRNRRVPFRTTRIKYPKPIPKYNPTKSSLQNVVQRMTPGTCPGE